LPTIRKELALIFVRDYNLKQKEIADLLGLRESTISQYLRNKRGKEIELDGKTKEEIKKSAKIIIKNKNKMLTEIQRTCLLIKQKGLLCKIHKRYENIKNCCICIR